MIDEFVDMIIHNGLVRQEIHVQVNAHLSYQSIVIRIAFLIPKSGRRSIVHPLRTNIATPSIIGKAMRITMVR